MFSSCITQCFMPCKYSNHLFLDFHEEKFHKILTKKSEVAKSRSSFMKQIFCHLGCYAKTSWLLYKRFEES